MERLIKELEITAFRGIEGLKLDHLGRVNLILGDNSTGKTSALEAIYFLKAHPGDPFDAIDRGEHLPEKHLHLFPGRPGQFDNAFVEVRSDSEVRSLLLGGGKIRSRFGRLDAPDTPEFEFAVGSAPQIAPAERPFLVHYASDLGAAQLWEQIALNPAEDDVLSCVQLISPDVRRISFVGNGASAVGKARINGADKAVSMATLGGGVNRLFDLACRLVLSQGNVLLIDEIESGIHHSAHATVWKFILIIAERLDIQVFATTHSLDCLRGLAEATAQVPSTSVCAIRLDKRGDALTAVTFNEREIQIAAGQEIEIR